MEASRKFSRGLFFVAYFKSYRALRLKFSSRHLHQKFAFAISDVVLIIDIERIEARVVSAVIVDRVVCSVTSLMKFIEIIIGVNLYKEVISNIAVPLLWLLSLLQVLLKPALYRGAVIRVESIIGHIESNSPYDDTRIKLKPSRIFASSRGL